MHFISLASFNKLVMILGSIYLRRNYHCAQAHQAYHGRIIMTRY